MKDFIGKLDLFLLNAMQKFVNFRHNHDGDAYLETADAFKWIGLPVAILTVFVGVYQKSIILGMMVTTIFVVNCYFPLTPQMLRALKLKSKNMPALAMFDTRTLCWTYAIVLAVIWTSYFLDGPSSIVESVAGLVAFPMESYMWFWFYYIVRTNKPLNKTKSVKSYGLSPMAA